MSEQKKTAKVIDMNSSLQKYFEQEWKIELNEWLESLDSIKRSYGNRQVKELLRSLQNHALSSGVSLGEATLNTPYRNTIHASEQPNYPGDIQLEQRIENIVRWNAMAMVLQANDNGSGVGGHIATYASAATFMEVMLNHFVRSRTDDYQGDMFNIQAHASPGIYARAFLEGRLTLEELANFRRELQPGGGLPSYPHPRRKPNLWPSPCASMGLSGVSAIYYARFEKEAKSGPFLATVKWMSPNPWALSILLLERDWIISSLLLIAIYNALMGRLEATAKSSKNSKQFSGVRNGTY
jgi:pyruvate dehydrogenase E1 component